MTAEIHRGNATEYSPIRLRGFEPGDLPALLLLDELCFPPQIAYSGAELQYFVRHPRSTTIVAERDQHVAGFCVVDWKQEAGRKLGHFITIDVAPELRRIGLGGLLMEAGEGELVSMGCFAVSLEVATNNAGALAFYQRLGYRQVGQIPGYYADGTDALVLRKTLDSRA